MCTHGRQQPVVSVSLYIASATSEMRNTLHCIVVGMWYAESRI
jgi:hypothetical protein